MKAYFLPFSVVCFTVNGETVDNRPSSFPTPVEQITITANRVVEPLTEVGGSLAVLDESEINLVGHQHINQLLARVPGGWISRGNGQEHLTSLRSPVLTGAGGCGAFFMAQDGIALRAPGFCNVNQLFDVNSEQAHQIEVLRGPAGALYGSNAVHGVINVLTPNPLTANSDYLSLTAGPHDYYRTNFSAAFLDQEQGEEQGLLAYGSVSNDGGYKDSSGYNQQKINLIHQYQQGAWSVKSVISASFLNQDTAGFITGLDAYKDQALKKHNPNPEAFRNSDAIRAYAQVQYQLSADELIKVTPFVRHTDMTFLQHYLPWQSQEENKQTGFGVQAYYQKAGDNWQWLVGLDTDWTMGSLLETQDTPFSPTIPQGTHYDYDVEATVLAPFSLINWHYNEALMLSAALRYEYTEYDYQNNLTNGSACADDVENCRFYRPEEQMTSYNEWSYQLSANYQVKPDFFFYSKYSTGYRAPQATELFRLQAGQEQADLDAERVNAVELGLKKQGVDYQFELAAFTMEKDNFIFQDTNRFNISNGETSHQGIELAGQYELTESVYVKANATFAKHKYQSNLTLSKQNIKGNEIDTAPEHMGSMRLGWSGKGWFGQGKQGQQSQVELEWLHLGNYYLNPENTAEYGGHNLVNLRSSITLSEQVKLSAMLLNVLDEDYAERADFGFGNYRYFVGEPRSLFVTVSVSFD